MSLEVSIHKGESQESLLRRFQKVVQTSGVLREVKKADISCPAERRHVSKRNRVPDGDDVRVLMGHDKK